ncbi:MAG TPA: hypothetical protein PKA29_01085 [Candidatus Saccharibacteria bacterium]|nr:hypothetical protein [Candidatus Saccharibacteria bacterium]
MKGWRLCRLSEAPTPPLLAVGGLPENPTLSTKKEKYGGGNSKNNSRGGFSGWTHASFAGIGVGAELLALALEIGSSFGVKCHQSDPQHFLTVYFLTFENDFVSFVL